MGDKYIFKCKCGATHDVTKQMLVWKMALFEKISKLVKEFMESTTKTENAKVVKE